MRDVLVGWTINAAIQVVDPLSRMRPTSVFLALRVCKYASRAGDARRTRQAARRTLDALASSPAALAAQITAAEWRPKVSQKLDQERALEALEDLNRSLGDSGLKPFLVFGALLGFVRQQGFIPGDSDLDFGILNGSNLEQMHLVLQQSDLKVSAISRIDGQPSKMVVKHPNGCKIDVKSFESETDGSLTWHTRYSNIIFTKRYPYKFSLKSVNFCGIEVRIPNPAEDFLEWQYGPDWRVPDPDYNVYTSGPIHSTQHLEFIGVMGPWTILRTLRLKRAKKCLAMAHSMSGLFPDDDLWPRLITALEAAFVLVRHQSGKSTYPAG